MKINKEEIIKEALKYNYKVLDFKIIEKTYQKQVWVLLKCPNENHESYWQWWNNFKTGYRCKECSGKSKWTNSKVDDFFLKYGLKRISEFKNVDTPILCTNEYGYKIKVSISNLKRNGKYSIWHKEVAIYNINLFIKKERNDYELCSTEWKGIKSKYVFKYKGKIKLKNNYFETTIDSFFHGKVRHTEINMSKGEEKIYNFLIENNIKFKKEYTFDDLKYKRKLRFDFAIFYKEKLKLLIEFQGEQHFNDNDFFSNNGDLQLRDKIKKEYCQKNNIQLLEINYKDINKVNKILQKEINNYSETIENK